MAKKNIQEAKFVVRITSDDEDLLTPRRIYQVMYDESAAKSNYIRVIDNEGEDYLYPANYFLFIELPRKIELALLKAA
jgi:CRISPR/Cas system-associated protein Cas5 (RAMP superfamily)